MNTNWNGIIKVLEIQHVRNGQVIWEEKKPLYNTLHGGGEEYFLKCLFANDGSLLPESYYLGLDNRDTIAVADTMDDLEDEPTTNGYIRQTLGMTGWNVTSVSGVYRAIGNIITFSASGGSWGPINNLFLTNEADDSGVLIATVLLSSEVTLDDGDSINMRMSLSLRDYPN